MTWFPALTHHQQRWSCATSNVGALLLIGRIAFGSIAYGQDTAMSGQHGGPVLFVAQMDAGKVVPRSTSRATATGAFIAEPARRTVAYDLTYQGLEHGGAKSVALHNYGAGGNGARVYPLCGDATRCPAGPAGNLTGVWRMDESDRKLLGELASARIYVEITGGDG